MVVPDFIKIMVGDFKSELRFPRYFVKKFGLDFPDKAIFETKYGESWSIDIEKIGDDYFLKHGWAQFVKYHQLQMGDLLHFKPIPKEKLTFRIFMFSPNACEKEISFNTQCNSDSENTAKRRVDIPSSSKSMSSPDRNLSKTDDMMDFEGRINVPDDLVGKKRQCLFVSFRDYNKYRINIPIQFAKENKLMGKEYVRLENSVGKTWRIKLVTRYHKRQTVMEMAGIGWSNFWKQNGLMCGAKCILEFIPGSDCFRFHLVRRD